MLTRYLGAPSLTEGNGMAWWLPNSHESLYAHNINISLQWFYSGHSGFSHYTSARRRYVPHDKAMKNNIKISRVNEIGIFKKEQMSVKNFTPGDRGGGRKFYAVPQVDFHEGTDLLTH